jgi:BASS family bile acid:Na+ symporter
MRSMGLAVAILSALYLVSMMFTLGLELGGGAKESKDEKRVKRRVLIRGLILNLVVLPAVAFGVVRALHVDSDISVALLLLMASPGGRFAPHFVKLAGANVALSVEVTLFLAKLTGFTAAPTVKAMLTLHALEVKELPLIAQLVVLQLVPYYFGRWLRKAHRPLAERLLRPAHTFVIVAALATLAVVLVKGDRGILHLLDDRGWFAVLAVMVASPILGWLAGGRRESDRRALAIEANARELALALVIASAAFPNQGVHTALFGIWSLTAIASFLLASAYRGTSGRVRAAGPGPAVPAGARSVPGH